MAKKKIHFTALVDSREKKPLQLKNGVFEIPTRRVALQTGDYSILGLERRVAIERKSLEDLISCIGRDRLRFEREIERLLAFETRLIVVEATWADIERGLYRAAVSPDAATGSVLGWIARGVPVVMLENRERAGEYVARLLEIVARRALREVADLREHAEANIA